MSYKDKSDPVSMEQKRMIAEKVCDGCGKNDCLDVFQVDNSISMIYCTRCADILK